jgi:hypothetical protein
MPSDTREQRIRASVPCPICGVGKHQPCRQGRYPHDARNGPVDKRPLLRRAHDERRQEWQAYKRQRAAAGDPIG